MQLYVFPPSPNSLRCQAVANQLGIELELINVDLLTGAHTQPDFVALNPNHKIPTLVDGDFVLWESGAIMSYLARSKPQGGLIPEAVQAHANMMKWLFWNECHWGPSLAIFTFENLVKKHMNLGAPDPTRLEHGQREIARFGAVLNDHLNGRDTLVGDSITLADHALASWMVHSEAAGMPLDDFSEITRWSGAILGSAVWQQALATMAPTSGGD